MNYEIGDLRFKKLFKDYPELIGPEPKYDSGDFLNECEDPEECIREGHRRALEDSRMQALRENVMRLQAAAQGDKSHADPCPAIADELRLLVDALEDPNLSTDEKATRLIALVLASKIDEPLSAY